MGIDNIDKVTCLYYLCYALQKRDGYFNLAKVISVAAE